MLIQVMLCYTPNVPRVLPRSPVHCALPQRLALVGKWDGETMGKERAGSERVGDERAGSERVGDERMVVRVLSFSAGHYLGVEWKTLQVLGC